MSQEETILAHLQAGNSITPAQAYAMCGTLALHSRIADIRKRGHTVRKTMRCANGKRWGEYSMQGEPCDAPQR